MFLQVIGVVVALVGLIIIGVAAGVTAAKKSSSKSTSKSTSKSGSPTGSVNQTNPNDPSTFEKNPKLKQSFYGIAYTPEGSQLPNCGNKLCMYNALFTIATSF
jgi:septal ring-binding cell division protein DamX